MAETSNIEWTRSTFNPWWGCTKVSPGCDNCYAERDAHRFGTGWGPDAERRFFGGNHWDAPRRWNAKAAKEQAVDPTATWRVFCASMADVFDNAVSRDVRERLWKLIDDTPHLTWLLLTKRIGNVSWMIPDRWSTTLPRNVWLGISVVNQQEADRDIPKLLQVKAHIRWLSMEPLLGPVNLQKAIGGCCPQCRGAGWVTDSTDGGIPVGCPCESLAGLSWVVVGGESGHAARPMHPEWARSLRNQCRESGVPFLFKQWGEWAPVDRNSEAGMLPNSGYIHPTMPRGQLPRPEGGLCYGPAQLEALGCAYIAKVGKKASGRLLDGVQHDGYPAVRA